MAERLQSVQERLDLAISDRAVRTSFVVSWESLDGALRQVFALLAVFEGRSFAAPALAALADLDVYTAEDRLFALTALSLLTEEEEVRYRQHPLLADFAREQLGNNDDAWRRMAHYYQHFAQEHQTDYAALQPEWENMMAGMQTAHILQEWQLVLDYADTLTEPWFSHARYSEAREAYSLVLQAAEILNDRQALATCLLRWGQACSEQDDHDEAESLIDKSIAILQEIGDAPKLSLAYYHLGRSGAERSKFDYAENQLLKCQALCESAEDLARLAAVYYQQSFILYRRGKFVDARLLCERALSMQEERNDWLGLLPTLRLLADIALEQEDYELANLHCQRALELCDRLQNLGELGAIYYSLTVVARLQENYTLAHTYAERGLFLLQHAGYRQFEALILYELSRIHAKTQNYDAALDTGVRALTLIDSIRDNFNKVYIMRHLGDLYDKLGMQEKACHYWQEALNIANSQLHPLTAYLIEQISQC